ncbi:MAG: methylmalonyl Co-A mutase-associated GTPase MeaB [Betaproteobacteria bacterium]|nr:methylmalonyl Co-A mutase-associated GTPase MeaB [Betaproteobacteria bacterium]
MGGPLASAALLPRLYAGEGAAIARMLTRAEAATPEAREALAEIYRRAGRAHVIGITGVPGSGKSTLVGKLTRALRATHRKVGIIAVDPSSPFSGGAILGDRIRMSELATDPGVFIRSMATRGSMGGLARSTQDAVDILDAAGFHLILIETVGVGQDEVEIAQASHTTIVVSAPGLGDDIQAIKAGVLEIADVHVVSKCDRPDSFRTVADLKSMLAMGAVLSRGGWSVPVVATSSERGEGIGDLVSAIDRHREYLHHSGALRARRQRIAEYRMLKTAEDLLRRRFAASRAGRVADLAERLAARELEPYSAAEELLNSAFGSTYHE